MNTNTHKPTSSNPVRRNSSEQNAHVKKARETAGFIAQRLELPSAVNHIKAPKGRHAGASLFKVPKTPGAIPTALFSQLRLSISEIPDAWLPAYAGYMDQVRRAAELTRALLLLDSGSDRTLSVVKDPIVAGAMLYLCSSKMDQGMRQVLLDLATTSPVGAWLAAEGLVHPNERETLVAAMRHDTQLLYWISMIPSFGPITVHYAKVHFDLFAGLIMAAHGSDEELSDWLHTASLAALTDPAAASACLLLLPNADPSEKRAWLTSLQKEQAAHFAWQVVQCARGIWSGEEWERLKTLLRPHAISDRARNFCLWFHSIEPERAVAALGESSVDELWGAELLNSMPDDADDFTFRFAVADSLGKMGDDSAVLVLKWLNQRFCRIRNAARH